MPDDEFEWDDRKAKRNIQAHGVTFELARLVFDDSNAVDWLDRDETEPENGDAFPDDLPANQFQYALHLFGWNHSRFQPLNIVFAWLYCQVFAHRSSLSSC